MTKKYIFTFCTLFICYFAAGQTFDPDHNGHVSDPKFAKLIKSRGYQLVGAFDTLQFDPLVVVAPFQKNGKWGRIDNHGKVVDEATSMDYAVVVRAREVKGDAGEQYEVNTRAYNKRKVNFIKHSNGSGLYGTRDSLGREGIPTIYQELNIYSVYNDTVAIVGTSGIYGALATNGQQLVPIAYDKVMISFNGSGAFTITKEKLLGVYYNGREVIPPKYDRISFDNRYKNLVKVTTDSNKTALFNLNGVQLSPFKYSQILDFTKSGIALYRINHGTESKMGLIDTLGKQIGTQEYSDINWFSPTSYVVSNFNNHHQQSGVVNLKDELITHRFYGHIDGLRNGLARVSSGSYQFTKMGFIDSAGNEVIKPDYTYVDYFNKAGFAVITVDSKRGLINTKGDVIVQPIYDIIDFNPLRKEYYITQNKKRGLMTIDGKVKILPTYEKLYSVGKYGYCAELDGKQGLLDDDGKVMVTLKYDQVLPQNPYKVIESGIANAELNGNKYRVDMYGNEYTEKVIAEHAQAFKPDKDGYVNSPEFLQFIKERGFQLVSAFDTLGKNPLLFGAKVMVDGKWKAIDTQGRFIAEIPQQNYYSYNDIKVTAGNDMEMGIGSPNIAVDEVAGNDTGYVQVVENGKYGTINKSSNKVGLPAIYDNLSFMGDGHVLINLAGKYGVAMTDGRVLIQPGYASIRPVIGKKGFDLSKYFVMNAGKNGLVSADGTMLIPVQYDQLQNADYSGGSGRLLRAEVDKKWGFITTNGKILVAPVYDELVGFTHGLYKVAKGTYPKQYGLIDSTGKVILEPVYNYVDVDLFKKAIHIGVTTDSGEKQGYLTLTGSVIFKPVYEVIGDFSDGEAVVEMHGKYGVVTTTDKVIIEPKYDKLYFLHPGKMMAVLLAGKKGVIDRKGGIVIPIQYDDIYPAGENFVFYRNGKWGLMSMKEKVLASFDYDSVEPGYDCLVVRLGNKYGLMAYDGKLITAIKYGRFGGTGAGSERGLKRTSLNDIPIIIDHYGNEYATR